MPQPFRETIVLREINDLSYRRSPTSWVRQWER